MIIAYRKDSLPIETLAGDVPRGMVRWCGIVTRAIELRPITSIPTSVLLVVLILFDAKVCNLEALVILRQLVTHREPPVVRSGAPDVRDEDDVGEVDDVEPAVEDEPAGAPVLGHEVWVGGRGEGEGVEEEEGKDDGDGDENAPPEVTVHLSLGGLLALVQVFHGRIEGIECPDVERCQGSGQR